MYTIEHVTDIDKYWEQVSPLLQQAIDHSMGEIELQDVYKGLQDQNRLIIVTDDGELRAALVIEPVDYPQLRTARIALCGGEKMRDWIPAVIQYVERLGRESGMNGIEIIGREGWVKMLKPLGFRKAYTHIIKEIDNG